MCDGPGIDVDGDGRITCSERTSITDSFYAAPSAFRAWAKARVFAQATVSFSAVPPAASALMGNFSGPDTTRVFSSGVPMVEAASRSGFYEAEVTNPPAHSLCPVLDGTVPLTGALSVSGTCLDQGLLASLVQPIE
jgi:hypothetical protein